MFRPTSTLSEEQTNLHMYNSSVIIIGYIYMIIQIYEIFQQLRLPSFGMTTFSLEVRWTFGEVALPAGMKLHLQHEHKIGCWLTGRGGSKAGRNNACHETQNVDLKMSSLSPSASTDSLLLPSSRLALLPIARKMCSELQIRENGSILITS